MMNQQKIIKVDTGDVPYPVFVLIGTTIWGAFAATIIAPTEAISHSRDVFTKLNVSVEAFILASTGRAVFNLLVMSVVLVPLIFFLGTSIRASWLLFPLAAMMVLAMSFTIGLALAPLGALYNDVKNAIRPVLGLLMFTTPVVFPIPDEPGFLATMVKWNPLTPSISFTRDTLVNGRFDFALSAFVWFAVSLLLILVAFLVLRVAKPHIIARMGM